MVVVVLGMHRSGTTCLTRMLQHAGMFLGSDLMDGVACSNLDGHAEAQEAVRINDRILEISGGTWDRVPATLSGDEETAARMRAFLQTLDGHAVAGWKDPRTTLTWPLWKPQVPAYCLVACVRHPLAGARSLQVRDGWPLAKGLALWAAYNERLVQHIAGEENVYWFHFDLPEAALTDQVQALCRRLGLPDLDGVTDAFNPYLRHHACSEPVDDPDVHRLYDRLVSQANGRAPVVPKPVGTIFVTEDRLAKLARVQQLHDELHQQQTRWLDDIRHVQVHFQDQLNDQRNSFQKLYADQQNALEDVQRNQAQLHQELQQYANHVQQQFLRQSVEFHEALRNQHRQFQEAMARLETMVHRLTERMDAQIVALEARNKELGVALGTCYGFMEQLRASLPFRCRRMLLNFLQGISGRFKQWLAAPKASPSDRSGPVHETTEK